MYSPFLFSAWADIRNHQVTQGSVKSSSITDMSLVVPLQLLQSDPNRRQTWLLLLLSVFPLRCLVERYGKVHLPPPLSLCLPPLAMHLVLFEPETSCVVEKWFTRNTAVGNSRAPSPRTTHTSWHDFVIFLPVSPRVEISIFQFRKVRSALTCRDNENH